VWDCTIADTANATARHPQAGMRDRAACGVAQTAPADHVVQDGSKRRRTERPAAHVVTVARSAAPTRIDCDGRLTNRSADPPAQPSCMTPPAGDDASHQPAPQQQHGRDPMMMRAASRTTHSRHCRAVQHRTILKCLQRTSIDSITKRCASREYCSVPCGAVLCDATQPATQRRAQAACCSVRTCRPVRQQSRRSRT